MKVPHRYRILPRDPGAHLFEVSVTVADPDPDGQLFELPAWIPGSYLIRDYARHVVGMRAEAKDRQVELTKLDKSRWRAAPARGALTVVAEIYAHDDSVRGAHFDTTHAYFNGTCVFLCVVGQEDRECEIEILAPEPPAGSDWRVATSMRRAGAEPYGFGRYAAANYAELIDHPVEIAPLTVGEFDVRGIPHAIAVRGRFRGDMQQLCDDLRRVCEQQMALLGAPQDLDRYLFLLNAPASGYGGLEHRWSSSLVSARDSLQRQADEIGEGYRTFLGLVSHEYFHLWNVKRMKPAAFTPYDLSRESHTTLLWVFEGVTSYYDDLALVRSGLITPESYLEVLGQTITRVLRGAGRLRQSIGESSFDAWTKFYKQDANAGNAIVSYYAKGALAALALDLTLRRDSGGGKCLDDVMRACWSRWGESGEGMPEDGFEAVSAEVSGLDLQGFFDEAVRGTADLPLAELLASHGVEYHLRPMTGRADKGGKPADKAQATAPWLGARLDEKGGKPVFVAVHSGGPAELAGVAPGDVAVALDGLAFDVANSDARLRNYAAGACLELVVFRGDELVTTRVTLADAPADTCYLTLATDGDEPTLARRKAWLDIG
jgi:predicted metalloprotease with PDZ domain